jgi:hypothetical protein
MPFLRGLLAFSSAGLTDENLGLVYKVVDEVYFYYTCMPSFTLF